MPFEPVGQTARMGLFGGCAKKTRMPLNPGENPKTFGRELISVAGKAAAVANELMSE